MGRSFSTSAMIFCSRNKPPHINVRNTHHASIQTAHMLFHKSCHRAATGPHREQHISTTQQVQLNKHSGPKALNPGSARAAPSPGLWTKNSSGGGQTEDFPGELKAK